MTYNQRIGRWGEEVAAQYLEERGYTRVAKNIYTPHGEIDLIMQLGEIVVFVEVKTRTSSRYGYPEEAITPRKLQHMFESAQYYAQENEIDHWQVDAVSVEGKPKGAKPRITHFEDVL